MIAVASVRVIMAAADHEAVVAKAAYTEKQPCKSFVRCRGSCATAVRRRPYISCNGCYRIHRHMYLGHGQQASLDAKQQTFTLRVAAVAAMDTLKGCSRREALETV